LRGTAVAAAAGGALSLFASAVPPGAADDAVGEAVTAFRLAADGPSGVIAAPGGDSGRRGSVRLVELGRDSGDSGDSDDSSDSGDSGDSGGDRSGGRHRQGGRADGIARAGRDDSDDHDGRDRRDDLESLRHAVDEAVETAQRHRAEAEDRSRRAAERGQQEAALGGGCAGLRDGGLGAVKSHVRQAGAFLGCRFGKPVMLGVAGRGGPSDHPSGLAIDFMVNRATGDALARCALQNMDALGVKYVIWEQRINFGHGWRPMADRGGITANHFDHVHVSFERGRGTGNVRSC